jgi:site-specific DNA-methyltransferase (adenine-specific)
MKTQFNNSTNVEDSTSARLTQNPCYVQPFSEVFNEDCIQVMKRYPDKYFDLAVVDPPYGIGANKMQLGNGKRKIYRGEADWDNAIPTADYWEQLFRVSKNQIVWGGNYMTEYLKPTGAWLFWDKGTGDNDFADGELAWTSYNGALRKITKSWVGANAKDGLERIHPTQKPIYLYDWIFNRFAKEGNLILDTHVGSGSSRIAAHKNKLNFVGFEIDKGYYEAQEKRFNAFISQQTLF